MKKIYKKYLGLFLVLVVIFTCIMQEPCLAGSNANTKKSGKSSIQLNLTKTILSEGNIAMLQVCKVKGLKSKDVRYKSSDSKVVSVTQKGIVKAKKSGKAIISVISKENKKVKAQCSIVVTKRSETKIIKLQKPEASLYVGRTAQIKIASTQGLESEDVTYFSTDTSVATVDNSGMVKAIDTGTAYIVVQSVLDSKVQATFKVIVKGKLLTYDEFDLSRIPGGGICENGKTYVNYIDYIADGNTNSHFDSFDIQQGYVTLKNIKVGSKKADVEKAYKDYFIEKTKWTYINIADDAEHIGTSSYSLYYINEEKKQLMQLGFIFDQNDIVMTVGYWYMYW